MKRHRDADRVRRLAHVFLVLADACDRFADLVDEVEARLAHARDVAPVLSGEERVQ